MSDTRENILWGKKKMTNDDYVKPPKKFDLKNIAGVIKDAYSYLHPNYLKRKLIHLILVVPMDLLIYALIYALIAPWKLTTIDTILICILTMLSAYFYPFSFWWYKQSFTGSTLNDMYYIGSISEVFFRKIGTLIFGIVLAGVLSPITGPLALRKCRKKKMMIGDACDFE